MVSFEGRMKGGSPTHVPTLATIEGFARRAERRLRAGRALGWASRATSAGLVLVAILVVLRKAGVLVERTCIEGIAIVGLLVLGVAVAGYHRRLARREGAIVLDRFHKLDDRLSSALSFAELKEAERSPLMRAAIDDAIAHAKLVDPSRAVPIRLPREWPLVLGMGAVITAIAFYQVRRPEPIVHAKTIESVDVSEDDLDAMREFLRDVDARLQSDEAKAATGEFNQLIEDLSQRRLDQTEAFRKMQRLEDKLLSGSEADRKAFEDAVRKIGEELQKSDLAKPTGEALSRGRLDAAERTLKELAKQLREARANGKAPDKGALEKLRDALRQAAQDPSKRAEALEKRREELRQDLLRQRARAGDAGPQDEEEKSLLKKKERELERLDREHESQAETKRELDRLDRELEKAAEDLMKDLGASAEDLEQAAEDINRMAKREMSKQEKEELRQKLRDLRETLRQKANAGGADAERRKMFQRRARGQAGASGAPGERGERGGAEKGGSESGESPSDGDGEGQQGAGNKGESGKAGEAWVLGPNGEKLLMITKGSGRRGGSGATQGAGEGSEPGRGIGRDHEDAVLGKKATSAKMGTADTQVEGTETGQGGSRSEVILGAAERGFATKRYKDVYREYQTVAEEALGKDEIPGGYRFYVRRYFQLIRPREPGAQATGGAPPSPPAPSGDAP